MFTLKDYARIGKRALRGGLGHPLHKATMTDDAIDVITNILHALTDAGIKAETVGWVADFAKRHWELEISEGGEK